MEDADPVARTGEPDLPGMRPDSGEEVDLLEMEQLTFPEN